jgi:hypothetical protein
LPQPTPTSPDSPATPLNGRDALVRILRLAGLSAGTAAAGYWLSTRSIRPAERLLAVVRRDHTVARNPTSADLAVLSGDFPRALVQRALQELGGIQRFISRSDVVIVKPNIAWDRTLEQAVNTNPEVVAEVVRQCWSAGAKKVIVTDVSCNDPRRCFQRSGIADAAAPRALKSCSPIPQNLRK